MIAFVACVLPARDRSAARAALHTSTQPVVRIPWCPWRLAEGDWWGRTLRVSASARTGRPRNLQFARDGFYGIQYCSRSNGSPGSALSWMLISFVTGDTAALSRLLTHDFRFTSEVPGFRALHPLGLGRAAMLDSVARQPTIDNHDRRSSVVPSLSVLAEFHDTMTTRSPVQPGQVEHVFGLKRISSGLHSDVATVSLFEDSVCVFVMVRGDRARPAPGQPRDPQQWYVSRWSVGRGTQLSAPAAPVAANARSATGTLQLAIRRASALGAWPLSFDLDLPTDGPAVVEVFDPLGRCRATRALAADAPGTHHFALESPVLASGVYWLRLSQSGRRTSLKFVVVR